MSKSIYEEMLEIIDRNIFELPMGFAVLYEIRKKIQQAQKQEKLLELYKKLNKIYETIYSMSMNVLMLSQNINYYGIEIIKLEQQIKELEKDEQ